MKNDEIGNTELNEILKKVKLPNGRGTLPIPDHEETLTELIQEGQRLLDAEEKKKTRKSAKKGSVKQKKISKNFETNPYYMAKQILLAGEYKQMKLVIEQMDKGEIPKDRMYNEFVKAIAFLGDKMSK